MVAFRILHLTDLHWGKSKFEDQKFIINELIADLTEVLKSHKPNLIIFSGDLVDRGSEQQSFDSAKAELLDRSRDACGLTDADVLLCPGNHDVDRPFVEDNEYVELGLASSLVNRDKLNHHIDRYISTPISQDPALLRQDNYFKFLRKHYHQDAVLKTNYVDCFTKRTDIGKIGFAVFNTSWRSRGAGEIERNTLLLGQRTVDRAVDAISDADLKIGVMHHPLDWLARWDSRYASVPLLTNFDFVFYGHVHEAMPTLTRNAVGECVFLQGGCLYEHQDYFNGYQIVDIEIDQAIKTNITLRTWFNFPKRKYGPAENICAGGLLSISSKSVAHVGQRLKTAELISLQTAVDDYANKHMKTIHTAPEGTFEGSFTCPPLSNRPEVELSQLSPTLYKEGLVPIEKIYSERGTSIVVGARESGKTSVALKVAKNLLRTTDDELRIPVVIDFAAIKKYETIERATRRYLAQIELDIPPRRIIENHRCVFIIDNVSLAEGDKIARLKELIKNSGGSHDWVIFLDEIELLSKKDTVSDFAAAQSPIYILPLRRNDIRSLVNKFPTSVKSAAETTDVIVRLIVDNNLPKSPYIVTILISIFASASIEGAVNEAALLDKLIDILLNKQGPENLVHSGADFAALNIILEEIALWLSENDQYMNENDLVGRLVEFFSERGIKESAAKVFERFILVGILDRVGEDVCFRHRSFEAYFLAKYAARNRHFVARLLEGLNIIKYRKEFSLLCDLSRNDEDLLTYLEVTVSELVPDLLSVVDPSGFLNVSLGEEVAAVVDEQLAEISDGPKDIVAVDEIADFADRAKSGIFRKTKELTENVANKEDAVRPMLRTIGYLGAWQVWGRALTSLDFVHLKIRKPSFVRLLDHWARIATVSSERTSKFFLDILTEAQKQGKVFPSGIRRKFEYLARVNIPLSMAQSVFEHIGASSVHQLLIETYDELPVGDPKSIGALSLLIKLRPVGWVERVERFIDVQVPANDRSIIFHMLLDTLASEYRFKAHSDAEAEKFEKLLAKLFGKAKNMGSKIGAFTNRIEQRRAKTRLMASPDRL